jgi:7,8-dihydro-6-hydroxymethylpterin-pyrophosphokinase
VRAIAIAVGSNLGARERNLRIATDALAQLLRNFKLSTIIETAPVGVGLEHDPPYLNAAGVGESDLPVRAIFILPTASDQLWVCSPI